MSQELQQVQQQLIVTESEAYRLTKENKSLSQAINRLAQALQYTGGDYEGLVKHASDTVVKLKSLEPTKPE